MKAVLSTMQHPKRVAVAVVTLCLLLSSFGAFYTYYIESSSQEILWRYYGPAIDTRNPSLEPDTDIALMGEMPSRTILHDYSSQHIVSSSHVRLIHTTLPSSVSCNSTLSPPKLILLWTPFFDSWEYFPPLRFEKCRNCTNCKVTADRSRLLDSDAIIFHCRDIILTDLPHVRLPHQKWVFYCLESPEYSDFEGMDFMQNMFNWTMTYRRDSDIVIPYGQMQKVISNRTWNKTSLSAIWSKKTKSIVWMCSHCPTYGNRDLYVSQLARFIDIDIYGICGTKVCARNSTHKCFQQFSTKYKFFLAFENYICNDYVTEKFFRTFSYDIVPVVFGGAQYENYASPGSYIDALSFPSPKHLASFLSGVGNDFTLYSSYFRWRDNFVSTLSTNKECYLCELLHSGLSKKTVYSNMRDWWVRGGQCSRYKA